MLHTACMVLGRSFQATGDIEMATQYFMRLADMASAIHETCADACQRLGLINTAQGNHLQAVKWFEKAYAAAGKAGNVAVVAAVGAQFGIARCRALQTDFLTCIANQSTANVEKILEWKNFRVNYFGAIGIVSQGIEPVRPSPIVLVTSPTFGLHDEKASATPEAVSSPRYASWHLSHAHKMLILFLILTLGVTSLSSYIYLYLLTRSAAKC